MQGAVQVNPRMYEAFLKHELRYLEDLQRGLESYSAPDFQSCATGTTPRKTNCLFGKVTSYLAARLSYDISFLSTNEDLIQKSILTRDTKSYYAHQPESSTTDSVSNQIVGNSAQNLRTSLNAHTSWTNPQPVYPV